MATDISFADPLEKHFEYGIVWIHPDGRRLPVSTGDTIRNLERAQELVRLYLTRPTTLGFGVPATDGSFVIRCRQISAWSDLD